MLSPYRALDLTDAKGQFCGKVLGDLGCDVIKIEKPEGDAARNQGPFCNEEPNQDQSLFWLAHNTNKRSITLDIETTDGKEIFKKLVKGADFVIESFRPGYMASMGIGYSELSKLNPRVILTSITPFGQDGPYSNLKASDIVVEAMSGIMYWVGDKDRPPVSFSVPQAFLHGCLDAVQGTLIALYYREQTGNGQHLDVSAQESLMWFMAGLTFDWLHNDGHLLFPHRDGSARTSMGRRVPMLFHCKDGFVSYLLLGGHIGSRSNSALVQWMESEGMADDQLKRINWAEWQWVTSKQQEIDKIEKLFAEFFLTQTKNELFSAANQRGILLAPVYGLKETMKSPQLDDRDFWQSVEHPELGLTMAYPGLPFKDGKTPRKMTRRAPLIGEHNESVYINEVGFTREQMIRFKEEGII